MDKDSVDVVQGCRLWKMSPLVGEQNRQHNALTLSVFICASVVEVQWFPPEAVAMQFEQKQTKGTKVFLAV